MKLISSVLLYISGVFLLILGIYAGRYVVSPSDSLFLPVLVTFIFALINLVLAGLLLRSHFKDK